MIFVNFKTYQEGTGENALNLARVMEQVSEEMQFKLIPVVQAADIRELTQSTKLEVWSQHIDPVTFGAHTGAVLPEAIKEDGAQGTFLNHSENKFKEFAQLETAINRAKELELKTLVFATNIDEIKRIIPLSPTYISYEPAELVGSTTVSVSTAHPDIIAKAADITRSHGLPLIVGAGVHTQEDIRVGLRLGAVGFAIATNIVKAKDPRQELINLIEGYKG